MNAYGGLGSIPGPRPSEGRRHTAIELLALGSSPWAFATGAACSLVPTSGCLLLASHVWVSRLAASQVSWPQVHAVPTLCPTRNGLSAALHCSCGESVGLVVTAAKLSPSSTGGTRLAFITSTGSELTPRCSYWAAESRRRSAFVGHEGGCQHFLSVSG